MFNVFLLQAIHTNTAGPLIQGDKTSAQVEGEQSLLDYVLIRMIKMKFSLT